MKNEKFLLYISVFAIMGLSNSVIPVLPELAAASRGSSGELASSLLFSGYFLGALGTMLPFGILADRYGNFRFVGLGLFLTVFSGVLILFSDNLLVLAFSRFLEGSACGAFFPAAFSILSESKQKSRILGEFNVLLNAGLASGTLFSGLLAEINLKGAIFIFTFMASVLLASIVPRIRELICPAFIRKKVMDETSPLRQVLIYVSRATEVFLDRRFLGLWALCILLNGAIGILIASYPDYSAGFITKAQLGISIASLYVCAMLSSLLVGRIAIGVKNMIWFGTAFSAIGVLLAIHHPLAGFSVLGGGSGLAIVGFSVSVAHMGTERGLSMGLFNTCTYAGLALFPLAAAATTGILSYTQIFLATGSALAVSLFVMDIYLSR